MLKRLVISNFAIIENIDISFQDGFTVLTGETGAGKSLVIDSLSLLLGNRASSELIRQGEDKAVVQGVFNVHKPKLSALLKKLGVEEEEDIVIERTISKTKNIVRINGVVVSLNDLQKVGPYLCDIHSQFDFAKILNPENYLSIVDGFNRDLIDSYKENYRLSLETYKKAKEELLSLIDKQKKIEENRDFYEYQYKELKAMDLKEGEEEEIETELSLLKNYDKIYSLEEEAKEIINGSFLEDFYNLNKTLEKLSSFQSQFEEDQKTIDDRYYEMEDLLSAIKKKFSDLDYDPSCLDELEQRSSDLESLKRKYKKDLPGLISYRDELASLVGNKSDLLSDIKEKESEVNAKREETYQKGLDLSLLRQKTAKKIEKELEATLSNLLLKTKFQISFAKPSSNDDSSFYENGIDSIDFLIETNVGEGLKSLSKILSGGEASRVMLAFKALFIKANDVPTVVFDEIDTGMSGVTASAVAREIHKISLNTQVIAITHMPQVASLSDHHILISKEVKGDRTFAHMKELSLKEKIEQVAYLISGDKVTQKQLQYAEEMVLSKRD